MACGFTMITGEQIKEKIRRTLATLIFHETERNIDTAWNVNDKAENDAIFLKMLGIINLVL